MDTRSGSSSPDPLAYPGDPEYLLSSATKPHLRRFSFTPRKAQTPRRRGRPPGKRSAQKSVKDSAQSIQYQDIILPSTPSGGPRFNRQSLSPTKTTLQSDGNISPWRIRVTVEAERDEDEENANNAQASANPWLRGKTTKIPLKGGTSSAEPTPKRRRTQKSKAEISERVPTPRRRREIAAGKILDSVEKKKLKFTENPPPAPIGSPSPAPSGGTVGGDDPFLDLALGPTTLDGDNIGTSPADNDEDQAIDIEHSNSASHDPGNQPTYPVLPPESPKDAPLRRSVTPELAGRSPARPGGAGLSPINTVHAGRTPRPKARVYPTPTPSSLLDDDGGENAPQRAEEPRHNWTGLKSKTFTDPTDEHRDFDTIMESEGFSMVSLNTLPSAKQRLDYLSQNQPGDTDIPHDDQDLRSGNQPAYGQSPPLHSTTPQPASNQVHHSRTYANQATLAPESHEAPEASEEPNRADDAIYNKDIPHSQNLYPRQSTPPHNPATQPIQPPRRRPLVRLARVVRSGIALQGILDKKRREVGLQRELSNPNLSPSGERETVKARLDDLFEDFDSETQRELRAGLRFGEELANRLRQANKLRQEQDGYNEDNEIQRAESPQPDAEVDYPDLAGPIADIGSFSSSPEPEPPEPQMDWEISTGPMKPPSHHSDALGEHTEASIDSMIAQREAEWQRERQAISRQIQEANASQVIVIDSDEVSMASVNDDLDEPVSIPTRDIQEDINEEEQSQEEGRGLQYNVAEVETEAEAEIEADGMDEDFEDIWQLEAKVNNSHHSRSQSSSLHDIVPEAPPQPRRPNIPKAWRAGEKPQYDTESEEMLPVPEWPVDDKGFASLSGGTTKMSKYRDVDATSSSILGTPDSTPNHAQENTYMTVSSASRIKKSPRKLAFPPAAGQSSPGTPPKGVVSRLSYPELQKPQPIPEMEEEEEEEEQERRQEPEQVPEEEEEEGEGEEAEAESSEESLGTPPRISDIHNSPTQEVDWVEAAALSASERMDASPSLSSSQSVIDTEEHGDEKETDSTSSPSIREAPEPTSTAAWFNKLTNNLTPAWLTSTPARTVPVKQTIEGRDSPDLTELSQISSHQEVHPEPEVELHQSRKGKTKIYDPPTKKTPKHYDTKPLALSGYFTDDHYYSLRHIYRQAKERPDKFIYKATPERDALLGRWMWSADNLHRREITETQFAIVERFIKTLVDDDIRHGGEGIIGWSEEDVLWRLFSIIVGEQLRRERKTAAVASPGRNS